MNVKLVFLICIAFYLLVAFLHFINVNAKNTVGSYDPTITFYEIIVFGLTTALLGVGLSVTF